MYVSQKFTMNWMNIKTYLYSSLTVTRSLLISIFTQTIFIPSLYYAVPLFNIYQTTIRYLLKLPADPSDLQSERARENGQNHPLLGPLTAISLLLSFIAYNSNNDSNSESDVSTGNTNALSIVFCLTFGCIGLFGTWVVRSLSSNQ